MKPEYEAIYRKWCPDNSSVLKAAIEDCEALAKKPQVRLNAEFLLDKWINLGHMSNADRVFAFQNIVLAAQPNAPVPEPVDVPFDYNEWSNGGWQAYLQEGQFYYPHDELVIGKTYVMRRK